MAVVHDAGHSEEERNAIGRMANDRRAGRGAEEMILLAVIHAAAAKLNAERQRHPLDSQQTAA
jgi:hypothetical protein